MNPLDKISNYPKSVLKIHQEFQTTAEQLLTQAEEFLNIKSDFEFEKSKRLCAIGFTQSKQSNLSDLKQNKEVEESNSLASLINHYQLRYPDYKFITEDQVKAICKKYDLVFGEINRYKGFVPDSNLRAIEFFIGLLKAEDAQYIENPYNPEIQKNYKFSNTLKSFNDLGNMVQIYCSPYLKEYPRMPLKICAPISEMDISGLRIIEDDNLTIPIPDPVVLQPVKGGYLIITAWGDEASDELVVNPKHN